MKWFVQALHEIACAGVASKAVYLNIDLTKTFKAAMLIVP
jgi:hypothetical protein